MTKPSFKNFTHAEKELTTLKYIDLKIACIVRGMLFEDIVEGSYPTLSSWFVKHFYDKQDKSLLEQFDTWMAETLINRGHAKDSPLVNFRLSTTLDEEDNTKVTKKTLKSVQKVKKVKRERDSDYGIFKGTKKALTYSLAHKGTTVENTIKAVMEQFPEAQDKSIRIWFKRALKEQKK